MRRNPVWTLLLGFLVATPLAQDTGQPPTRSMNEINWMDFKRWVPDRIDTVFLPVGTLEAHGVGNNGADNTVPEAIAQELAKRVNGLVAPTIPYGVTTSLSAFPGTFRISPAVFAPYVKEVLEGLQGTGFKNLIVVNGHGPNYGPLQEICAEVSESTGARTLVFNWWTHTSDITMEVFGTDGGHAGVNENAAMLASTPDLVHPEYYEESQAWWREDGVTAYPYPNAIILYQPRQGYPLFDRQQANVYFGKVLDKLERLVEETVRRWQQMEP